MKKDVIKSILFVSPLILILALAMILKASEKYQERVQKFNTTVQTLNDLINGHEKYNEQEDGWGNKIVMKNDSDDLNTLLNMEFRSAGPNGILNDADDVVASRYGVNFVQASKKLGKGAGNISKEFLKSFWDAVREK